MQNLPANKMAHRCQYPRACDAFDRELKAVEDLNQSQLFFTRYDNEAGKAKVAEAEEALQAARDAYKEAAAADEAEFKLNRCP